MSQNYCYDQCPYNNISRKSIVETDEEGKPNKITWADQDKNKRLQCTVGFKQTVASRAAALNSIKNNTPICASLRKVLKVGR
jgi:hypothetical protein